LSSVVPLWLESGQRHPQGRAALIVGALGDDTIVRDAPALVARRRDCSSPGSQPMIIRRAIGKSAVRNMLLVAVSLAIGLVTLEAAGRVVATTVLKTGKLFRPDPELGWIPLANLDVSRKNANGDLWHIETDDAGIRGPSSWPDAEHRRLLVLGDSFAFGEGVDPADRFDTLIQEQIPNLAVVNLGVMGYGPDQQLLRARAWKSDLRRGDVLLLLTYGNDYYDLARTRHGGRSKPWLEDADDRLIEHGPAIDVFDHLRDRSYVFTLVTRSVAQLGASERTQERLERVDELYRKWVVQEVEDLVARGVLVVIAHHGDQVFELPFDVDAMFAKTCPAVSGCLALDEVLAEHPRDEIFLADGHWAAGGHRVAAEQIAAYLRTLPGFEADRASSQSPPSAVLDRGDETRSSNL
jgi:hypothetical protein